MQISLLCTNKKHPIIPYLMSWKVGVEQDGHKVAVCSTKSHLGDGDILFLISCSEKIGAVEFNKYRHVLVLHASEGNSKGGRLRCVKQRMVSVNRARTPRYRISPSNQR